jgi:hypothetical protein
MDLNVYFDGVSAFVLIAFCWKLLSSVEITSVRSLSNDALVNNQFRKHSNLFLSVVLGTSTSQLCCFSH